MSWYYAEGDQRVGPVTDEQLRALIASGAVTDSTMVWREGMKDWMPFGATDGISAAPLESPKATPASSSPPTASPSPLRPLHDESSYTSADHGRRDMLPEEFTYGGFWARYIASIGDSVLMSIVGQVFVIPFSFFFFPAPLEELNLGAFAVLMLVGFIVGVAYEVYFLGTYGSTPGKMAMGLMVVRPNGERITYIRAFARVLCELLSFITLFIGYIIAAFDDEKRALHDHICDTRIIRFPYSTRNTLAEWLRSPSTA